MSRQSELIAGLYDFGGELNFRLSAASKDGMVYTEFVERLAQARLSIAEFATLVRANKNSFTNCAKTGHVADHWGIVATLMSEMEKAGMDFRGPLRALDLRPKKARGAGRFGGDRQQKLF